MEQECIAGLYQSLGLPVGAEFSSEDVTFLYHKVFKVPSSTDEAHTAMRKLAGGDSSWSCAGEKVLDVLVQMESERDKNEKLYWEHQLLNVGNVNTLHVKETPLIINLHMQNHPQQSTGAVNKTFSSDLESSPSGTWGSDSFRKQKQFSEIEPCWSGRSVKRLKKAARHSWVRLVTEGVQSILDTPWRSKIPEFKGHAWGCVSMSDVLLLVEVKYDVVTHLLYTEMLQEHHTPNVWETLLPWQRHKEEEGLEDLAEEALESGDMLRLAELPGAFRIYRSCTESKKECWTAISLLYRLYTSRQQEKDALMLLGESLDAAILRLLCLNLRLATLRVQREKTSYGALLVAQQSWETWPRVRRPHRAELALLWLRAEQEEGETQIRDDSASPEQAVLQLLVLTQEQQRKSLVETVHGVSPEDLQQTLPPIKVEDKETSLRSSCVKRLRQIHATSRPQPEMQAVWTREQVEDGALVLLTQLMELQEVQESALLQEVTHQSWQGLQALRDQLEMMQQHASLLQFLISDDQSSEEQIAAPVGCSGPAERRSTSAGTPEGQTVDSVRMAGNGVQTEDKQEVCAGCGGALEDLPYLEMFCKSDATQAAQEVAARDEEEDGQSPQSFEKQGSLITLAWSKPPEDDTDEGEAADGEDGPDARIQLDSSCCTVEHYEGTSRGSHDEVLHPDEAAVDHLCSTGERTMDERHREDQSTLLDHFLCSGTTEEMVNVGADEVRVDMCPTMEDSGLGEPETAPGEDLKHQIMVDTSITGRKETRRERTREPVSAVERERTMRNLVDMQRTVEQRQQRNRERQLLRVQERLSIIQNRKAEEDLLGLKHEDRLRHLTQDLPQEDKNQQKTVVKERLEQLRRERSYVMQSKRDRNTATFKELLGPVTLHSRDSEDGAD